MEISTRQVFWGKLYNNYFVDTSADTPIPKSFCDLTWPTGTGSAKFDTNTQPKTQLDSQVRAKRLCKWAGSGQASGFLFL